MGLLSFGALLIAPSGCGDDASVAPADTSSGPTGASALAGFEGAPPSWSGQATDNPVVATVGGVPIRAADLRYQLSQQPGTSPRQALDALVVAEVLAQEAVAKGARSSLDVVDAWRQAMSRSYLEAAFEAEVTSETMPPDIIAEIYKRQRLYFNHAPGYKAAHLHFVCCMADREDCGAPAAVECFASAYPSIQDVYGQAKAALADAEGDSASMSVAFQQFATEVRRQHPLLAHQEFDFYYDTTVDHEAQRGRYDLVDETFAKAVIAAPMATLTEPIKSEYGWHVAVKLQHAPGVERLPTDPDVVDEIRTNGLRYYRQKAFAQRIRDLSQQYGLVRSPEPLEGLDQYWGKPPTN